MRFILTFQTFRVVFTETSGCTSQKRILRSKRQEYLRSTQKFGDVTFTPSNEQSFCKSFRLLPLQIHFTEIRFCSFHPHPHPPHSQWASEQSSSSSGWSLFCSNEILIKTQASDSNEVLYCRKTSSHHCDMLRMRVKSSLVGESSRVHVRPSGCSTTNGTQQSIPQTSVRFLSITREDAFTRCTF